MGQSRAVKVILGSGMPGHAHLHGPVHRGRLVEEFVRTDNRSFLRQLGAEGA